MSASFERRPGVVRLPNPMLGVVWLSLFIPGHLYEWWVERAFSAGVFLLGCAVLLTKSSPWEARKASRQASTIFFLIQFLYITSYVYSVAFNGILTGPRDYFEVVRYLFLWTFVVYLIRHFDGAVRRSLETALPAAMYYGLFVLAILVRPIPGVTGFFKEWLYARTKTSIAEHGMQMRLAAPFENPNFLGYTAVLTLCWLLFFSRSRLRMAHCTATLLVIYFTGSRTAWAAGGLVLAGAAAAYLYEGMLKLRIKFAVQLSAAFLLLVLAAPWLLPRVAANSRVRRVVTAFSRGGLHEEANAAQRLVQARQAMAFIVRSPVFGWGPSKYETMSYVDNQYLLWLLRSGFLGTGLILLGLGLASWRLLRAARGDFLRMTGTVTFLAAVAVMLLTGQFLENFRLFYITSFIAAGAAYGGSS